MPKPLTLCITTSSRKLLRRWKYQALLASWEICMQVRKQHASFKEKVLPWKKCQWIQTLLSDIVNLHSSVGSLLPSVQFSRSVTSNLWWPHGLQHSRLPCPSPTLRFTQTHVPRVGDAIQPSHPVVTFSSCPQSFPASGFFPMSQFFTLGGQSTGVSAWASVIPRNIQDWFPLGWTGWISLQSKGLSRVFNTTVQKHQLFGAQLSLWSNSHIHTWLLEKP